MSSYFYMLNVNAEFRALILVYSYLKAIKVRGLGHGLKPRNSDSDSDSEDSDLDLNLVDSITCTLLCNCRRSRQDAVLCVKRCDW